MPVITITYQIGSGGRIIGQALAERLGLNYIDRQIVERVAQQLNVSEQSVELHDERAERLATRILSVLAYAGDLAYARYASDEPLLDERNYVETTRGVIEAAARTDCAVIVGHGANFVLGDRPGMFHIYVYAPRERRVVAIMQREHVDQAAATRSVIRSDQDRAHYVKRFYHRDWQDPMAYHLMINTAMVLPERAVDLIAGSVQGCLARTQPH